ncbi:MAG: HesA/MoeB/ThiF family protein [Deltaproteobacteria bacterium]
MKRCAIVGIGGLGAPAAALLAASAEAHLTLIDDDRVDLSNLPRQPLYGESDLGRAKVEAAAAGLSRHYPRLTIRTHIERLEPANADRLLAEADVILDGTDNLDTKILLNEIALRRRTPLVHAGVLGLDGQLMSILPGESACLRCLFVEHPESDELPTCQQAGILAPVVGAIGLAAAREALYILRGTRPPLADRFAILDGRRLRWRTLILRRRPQCVACGGLAIVAAHREDP